MSNDQIIKNLVAKVIEKINFRMSNFEESYSVAKANVEKSSTAGVKVWEIVDVIFKAL